MLKLLVSTDDRATCSASTSSARAPPSWSTSARPSWRCGGTVDYLVDTVFNYPTLAEAYKVAALDAMNKMRAVARLTL